MMRNPLIFSLLFFLLVCKALGQVIPDEAKRCLDRGVIAVELAKSPADYESPIKEFMQATILAPNWPDAYYNLGLVQEKAEKHGDAAISFRQYLALAPSATDIDAVKNLIVKLEYLIDQSNTRDRDGFTPLHLAVRNGDIDLAAMCIAKGANVNDTIKGGITPLFFALINDQVKMVELLIAKGADVNARDHFANDLEAIRFYFPFKTRMKNVFTEYENAPLHLAALCGTEEVVGLLISKGADINIKNHNGYTPLKLAAIADKKRIAAFLIAKGADIDIKDQSGNTALHSTAGSGMSEMAVFLVDNNAGIYLKNDKGESPLRLAVFRAVPETLASMLTKVSDINAPYESGQTLMHWAAQSGQEEVIELIISNGADINAKDESGHTPIFYVTSRTLINYKGVIRLLKKYGAK